MNMLLLIHNNQVSRVYGMDHATLVGAYQTQGYGVVRLAEDVFMTVKSAQIATESDYNNTTEDFLAGTH